MGLFSSSKSTTQNTKRDSTVTVGGNAIGPFVTGNESSNITIRSIDSEVIKPALDFANLNLNSSLRAVVDGSAKALDAATSGFGSALEASKTADERLSGKVFTSVNIGLALAGLGLAVYLYRK